MRSRTGAFVVLAVACVVGAAIAVASAVLGARHDDKVSERAVAAARPRVDRLLSGGTPAALVRRLDRRQAATFGRMAVAPVTGGAAGTPSLAGASCARVAYTAGRGLCLDLEGTRMAANLLDGRLRTVHTLDLEGVPSRARISPDGRWGGVTAFVVGHSYAAVGTFSTEATIIDMRRGKVVGDLEKDFTVTNGGKVVDARDRNLWGLTFAADGDTFYATLATGRRTWLIRGSIRARRARTLHANVECPSLSPDGTRIAYKKAVAHGPTAWRFTVLDLASGRETPLGEPRSVDDQLEWLDDGHLLYGAGEKIWTIPADGSGAPRLWLADADSPAMIRRPAGQ